VQNDQADASATRPSAVRVIKKYPNRRLYDTDTSSYITLAEIKALVMKAVPFVVRDAKSGDDLTRSILLQIILEEETAGVPLFSESMLANIIRFYGHAMQGYMGTYLEKNLQLFMDMQKTMADPAKGWTPELWQQYMGMQTPVLPGMAAFTQMQEKMLEAMGVKR
jgi:polyhydroxyalkanoate synthesis repressor PhaR